MSAFKLSASPVFRLRIDPSHLIDLPVGVLQGVAALYTLVECRLAVVLPVTSISLAAAEGQITTGSELVGFGAVDGIDARLQDRSGESCADEGEEDCLKSHDEGGSGSLILVSKVLSMVGC